MTAKMLKELPRKGLVLLTYIYNAILRIGDWPKPLKTANIITIGKYGKDLTDLKNYRPISLLPIIAKRLEKLILAQIQQRFLISRMGSGLSIRISFSSLRNTAVSYTHMRNKESH
jgi:hypothetical protein